MSKSFAVRATETLEDLLDRLEACEALEDADMDIVDGVLTLELEDGSQIIINRQEPLQQIWVASPLGPAHFAWSEADGEWRDDRTGKPLIATLEEALSGKLGMPVRLG